VEESPDTAVLSCSAM